MPLTPTDVANKQFRIAFRGYSLDEVDAFLDEVETELSRLLRDNSELKNRPAAAPSSAASATPTSTPAPVPIAPLAGMEGQEAALRTLLLAQRTADEAIAEARAEAEQIVSAARAEADEAVSSARTEADRTLREARAEAEKTVGDARKEAESTLAASRKKTAEVDQEVAARIHAATGDLDVRRQALEVRIEELRAFEREYRTRLKAYLEGQLRDLDSRTGPDDGGAGVPAGAGRAAVGLTPGSAAGVRGGGPVPAVAPAPEGPPREADGPAGPGTGLRAAPPLSTEGAPVGPFTVVPSAGSEGGDDSTPPATDQ